MTKDNTPLEIIREKEVDLSKYLIKTQTKADKMIEDARKDAEKLKEKLAADGEQKAQEYYNKELAKLEKQAEEIRSQAPAKAKEAAAIGLKNLDKAIEALKGILVPR